MGPKRVAAKKGVSNTTQLFIFYFYFYNRRRSNRLQRKFLSLIMMKILMSWTQLIWAVSTKNNLQLKKRKSRLLKTLTLTILKHHTTSANSLSRKEFSRQIRMLSKWFSTSTWMVTSFSMSLMITEINSSIGKPRKILKNKCYQR